MKSMPDFDLKALVEAWLIIDIPNQSNTFK
jgi:hypothetical protein